MQRVKEMFSRAFMRQVVLLKFGRGRVGTQRRSWRERQKITAVGEMQYLMLEDRDKGLWVGREP